MKVKIEDKCLCCGTCCHLTFYDLQGQTVKTDIRCPHLQEDNLCSIYNNRPDWCMNAEEMKEKGILPKDCGYLKGG